jgi:hypothetical protein
VRVLARATAAAAVFCICVATGVADAHDAPGLERARLERLILRLKAQPGGLSSVRTRPLDLAQGAVYEIVVSGRGQGFDKVSGEPVCYDVLYAFDCDSGQRAKLHDRFDLAGRPVKGYLTPGPAYTAGYASLYRYRVDHTYSFLLQKGRSGLTLVQTCVFAPPAPCLGPARVALSGDASIRISFSTTSDLSSNGSFGIAIDRLGGGGAPGSGRSADTAVTLPGMPPQTPLQALAIIRTLVTRNLDACRIEKWGLTVSGFPARWKATVTVVRKGGRAVATWSITGTTLSATNALAAGVMTGCRPAG